MTWQHDVVRSTRAALRPLADPDRAPQMQAYMKDVAPFLGIATKDRRAAQRRVWRELAAPTPEALLTAARDLYDQPEREYHYAAVELLGRYRRVLPPGALASDVRGFVLTKPWWDTVDGLGSLVITPIVADHPALVRVMWDWNATDDQWLVRASIQHQRGRGAATDVGLVLAMCAPHATDRRFFVAKGVGWALRDLTRVDPAAVAGFLADHPELPAVARREAQRGLDREAGTS